MIIGHKKSDFNFCTYYIIEKYDGMTNIDFQTYQVKYNIFE